MKNHAVLKSQSFIIGAPPTFNMFVDQRKLEIPDANYLVASSPCIKQDQFKNPYPAKQTTGIIADLSEDARGKLLFVLNIFGRAVQERDEAFRFSLYWIALEVVTGTQGNGIAARLGNVYSRGREYAFNELEFRAAYDYRNALFHKGVMQSFSARLERLMQCYFYDFLRDRLNFSCKSLALNAMPAFQK
jgi:hypothetical protein